MNERKKRKQQRKRVRERKKGISMTPPKQVGVTYHRGMGYMRGREGRSISPFAHHCKSTVA